jgi:tetratricopeptide (TPR) repeat protein
MSDAVSELDEERDFLLRSIRDLDAEREAGDIDEADYRALRDDYTARAAAVLRAQAAPAPEAPYVVAEPVRPGPGRRRLVGALAGTVVVLALAGWLIASNTGTRGAGQGIGPQLPGPGAQLGRDPRLDQAQAVFAKGKVLDAIKLYDAVLKAVPNQPEALAYRGWLLRLAGLSDQGLQSINQAEAADPTYPDAHFFRGVILLEDKNDAAGAVKELRTFLASNPPPAAIPRAETELAQALKAGGPSVATTVDPRTNPAIAPNFGPTTTIAP